MGTTILIVDDDAQQLALAAAALGRHGFQVQRALGGEAAIEQFLLRRFPKPDVILVDLIMPDVSGVEVIKAIRRSDPHVPIIAMSPQDKNGISSKALDAGGDDCLHKPVRIAQLLHSINNHLRRETMRQEVCRLMRHQQNHYQFDDVIAVNERMKHAVRQTKQAARLTRPLLLCGEMGTGKELLSRAMHFASVLSDRPYISIDCRLPDEELHHILDGKQRELPLSLRKSATLYLRHFDALSPSQQQRLFERLNPLSHSRQMEHAPALRVVASSRMEYEQLIKQRKIHEDWRDIFNKSHITIPPLRERVQDILPLSEYYIKRFTMHSTNMITHIAKEAEYLLLHYPFKQNVSELIAMMQQASFLCKGPTLNAPDLENLCRDQLRKGVRFTPPEESQPMGQVVAFSLLNERGEMKQFDEIEAEIIRCAIDHYKGKMSEVARKLGIGRSTLYRKLQDYKIQNVA